MTNLYQVVGRLDPAAAEGLRGRLDNDQVLVVDDERDQVLLAERGGGDA